MKTFTVTGGTGYIGSKLLEYLSKNEDNYIYSIVRENSIPKVERDNIEYVVYDETEKSLETPIKHSDYIIHLGALYTTADDEASTKNLIDSNILFSTLIFNVANRMNKNAAIASASTFSALDGKGVYAPPTLYAATKSAVETIAHYYKDLSVHFLAFPDTYGPGDWRNKIHNILARNQVWPFQFKSSSSQEMRLLHVEDIIGHLLASLQDNSKGVKTHDIYAEGVLTTLGELSKLITDKECLFNENELNVDIPSQPREVSTPTGYTNKHDEIKFDI